MNPGVWQQLGFGRFEYEQFAAAVPPLQRAVQLQPQNEEALWLLLQSSVAAGLNSQVCLRPTHVLRLLTGVVWVVP